MTATFIRGRFLAAKISLRSFSCEPPDFFAKFVAGFFFSYAREKSPEESPPGKSAAKSSKNKIDTPKTPDTFLQRIRNQEKGVLAKGVSAECNVTAKETKTTQGYWPQQYIWHSERHSQERRTFLQKPPSKIYNVQMDAAVLGDRLPEITQKPFLGPGSPSLQCGHWESSKVLAGLAFCEMLSHSTHSLHFRDSLGGRRLVSSSLRPKPSASICSV